jgi:ATP phosphoribosyltransferase regulatory subunit
VGVFRNLVKNTELNSEQENRLFDMLQRKSIPDLRVYLQELPLTDHLREQICHLALLSGDISVIDEARQLYHDIGPELASTLDYMHRVVQSLQQKYPDTLINCDLSELRGYSYHTGLVFAAFLPGQGREIARGGRYNDVGEVFGNARPATGFSADLLNLYQLRAERANFKPGILVPDEDDAQLSQLVQQLRADGERVVVDLTNANVSAENQQCDRLAIWSETAWIVNEV